MLGILAEGVLEAQERCSNDKAEEFAQCQDKAVHVGL